MAATMKDIARATGLGLATISSYLNGGNVREKNRILIEQAIEELHFEVNEVARGLKTNRTKVIGIVIPELNNIFCAEIITEVEDVLRNHGYATMICDCRTDEKREAEAVEFLYHRRVDGLLIMPSGKKGTYLQKFTKAGKPVVMIDRKMQEAAGDCVLVDNEGAARDAVKRLIQAGHTKIGIIAGPKEVYTAEERLRGYELALKEGGIPKESALVERGNYTIHGGSQGLRKLAQKNPHMTAVFVSNYEMTLGAIIEANELGIAIPEKLSIIGFDNIEFAKASIPRLSIVTQPTREIGRKAADLMLRRLAEPGKEKTPDRKSRITGDGTPGYERPESEAPGHETPEYKTIKLETSFVEGKSVKAIENDGQ